MNFYIGQEMAKNVMRVTLELVIGLMIPFHEYFYLSKLFWILPGCHVATRVQIIDQIY